ncbi:MAG: tyrosine-type recombinase/integrase [Planctomycetes bacterium]|nr:tyrosine-type recombinase/integrase [Planctomycetota bacterium]
MEAEIEAYLAQRAAEGLSPKTQAHYRRVLTGLAASFQAHGAARWADAVPDTVDAYLEELTQRYGFGSRASFTITARAFLRWLAESGAIPADPARHVTVPRPEKDDLPLPEPPLSEADVAELLNAMPKRNAVDLRDIALVELLYSGGLRISEALALDLRDTDFQNRVLHVRNGKGAKPRELPLLQGLFIALRTYLALRRSLLKGPDHGALLLTNRGQRLTIGASDRMFDKLNRRRGPKAPHLHAHRLRHSIAVHMLRGGADIRYIQAFLGHDSLESTKIYLRLVPADLRKVYDAAMPELAVST